MPTEDRLACMVSTSTTRALTAQELKADLTLEQLQQLVGLVEYDEHHDVFYPEECLDLGTALAAYTSGTAWVNHHDETGTIAVGALADLAVLDRDPFESHPDEIWQTTVEQTFVGGERVFAR